MQTLRPIPLNPLDASNGEPFGSPGGPYGLMTSSGPFTMGRFVVKWRDRELKPGAPVFWCPRKRHYHSDPGAQGVRMPGWVAVDMSVVKGCAVVMVAPGIEVAEAEPKVAPNHAEEALSALAYGVRSIERLEDASPEQIERIRSLIIQLDTHVVRKWRA